MNGNATINMNGQQVALKFGYPQVKEWGMALADDMINSVTGKGLFFEGESLTTWGYAHLVDSAYKNACLLKKVKPSITFEQFSNWIDENVHTEEFQKELQEVISEWEQSQYTKSWANQLKKNVSEIVQEINPTSKPSTSKSKRRSSQTGQDGKS